MKMKKKIKCQKCNHEWETKSVLVWVTCPSCQFKTMNKAISIQDKKKGI